jgi:hypothetical protein
MNEIQKYVATKTLATSDETFSRSAGGALVKTGLGATGLWMLAGMLPFITFPMVLIAAVVFGAFLYIKD